MAGPPAAERQTLRCGGRSQLDFQRPGLPWGPGELASQMPIGGSKGGTERGGLASYRNPVRHAAAAICPAPPRPAPPREGSVSNLDSRTEESCLSLLRMLVAYTVLCREGQEPTLPTKHQAQFRHLSYNHCPPLPAAKLLNGKFQK